MVICICEQFIVVAILLQNGGYIMQRKREILLSLFILMSPMIGQSYLVSETQSVSAQGSMSQGELAGYRNEIISNISSYPDISLNTISWQETEMGIAQIESYTLAYGPIEPMEVNSYFPNYQLDHATQITISDYSIHFYNAHNQSPVEPTPVESEPIESEIVNEDPFRVLTYEEAVAYAEAHPELVAEYWSVIRSSIDNDYGIPFTQAQYDWLPDDAAYWTLVHHKQVLPTGGDPSTTLQFLFEVYPELHNVTEESIAAESEETPIEETQKDAIIIEDTEFILDNYYILRPNEAGNQSKESFMFVIEFENEHDATIWYDNVEVAQDETLTKAEYQIEETEVEDNQESNFVYYELSDLTTTVNLTFQEQSVEVVPEDVFNLPPASASYLSGDGTLATIFDFGKIYALTQGEVNARIFDQVTDESTISPEAQALIEESVAESGFSDWVIYESDVEFEYRPETSDVYTIKDTESEEIIEIGTISTDSDWQDMIYNSVEYQGLHDWSQLDLNN